MSMIKGRNQHVMPLDGQWCVIDEMDRSLMHRFDTFEQAMAYARQCAEACEGNVLVHETLSGAEELSAVSLPQEHLVSGECQNCD